MLKDAKGLYHVLYGLFYVFYGYNLIDVLSDTLGGLQDFKSVSSITQTLFAVFGVIFLVFKMVHFVLESNHKHKMNKLNRTKLQHEIDRQFDEEYKRIINGFKNKDS